MIRMLPGAVVVAISPFVIVAIVLTLLGPRGHVNGPAFVIGWTTGLAIVGAVWLGLASYTGAAAPAGRSGWIPITLLAIGVMLLVAAFRRWRGRFRSGNVRGAPPRWLNTFDTLDPVRSAGAGLVLSLNPKNLLLSFAGVAEIVQTGVPAVQQVVAYTAFVAVATAGIATPVVTHLAARERSRKLLDRVKKWMIRNNDVIVTALSFALGVKLILDGLAGLSVKM